MFLNMTLGDHPIGEDGEDGAADDDHLGTRKSAIASQYDITRTPMLRAMTARGRTWEDSLL